MNKINELDHLAPIADEMLAGLHADERMRLRIRAAAKAGRPVRRKGYALVPAVCCAALALAVAGAALTPGRLAQKTPEVVTIETIAAGSEAAAAGAAMADLGDGARVRVAPQQGTSLFATGGGDIPMVAVDGFVYRMMTVPGDVGRLAGGQIGTVATHTDEPSLLPQEALSGGASNVAQEGAAIYAVSGLDPSTAVAAEVGGSLRLFQRVSYAGRGPGGQGLEDTFDVRGRVKHLELSGVGELTGDKANEVIAVLLDHAYLAKADVSARKEFLTVTLDNGLRLQLGVSGDMLCGCGGWSCPEFFEAFENAL